MGIRRRIEDKVNATLAQAQHTFKGASDELPMRVRIDLKEEDKPK